MVIIKGWHLPRASRFTLMFYSKLLIRNYNTLYVTCLLIFSYWCWFYSKNQSLKCKLVITAAFLSPKIVCVRPAIGFSRLIVVKGEPTLLKCTKHRFHIFSRPPIEVVDKRQLYPIVLCSKRSSAAFVRKFVSIKKRRCRYIKHPKRDLTVKAFFENSTPRTR